MFAYRANRATANPPTRAMEAAPSLSAAPAAGLVGTAWVVVLAGTTVVETISWLVVWAGLVAKVVVLQGRLLVLMTTADEVLCTELVVAGAELVEDSEMVLTPVLVTRVVVPVLELEPPLMTKGLEKENSSVPSMVNFKP